MFRPSYVVTLGLGVCKATTQASLELVRFTMWPFFVHNVQKILLLHHQQTALASTCSQLSAKM